MAAPHVAAIAALVIASGVLGPPPDARPDPQAGSSRPRSRWADPSRTRTTATACVDAGAATAPLARATAKNLQVVRTISTEQGAWWETLFGTEPSRKRLAPVIPLLPTTIRSARCSSATSRIASAASPWRANVSTSSTPARVGLVAAPLEHREHVLARVDHPLQVLRHLDPLVAQPLVGDRLVGADDLQPRAELARELDRLAHSAVGRVRAIGADEDRGEHAAAS